MMVNSDALAARDKTIRLSTVRKNQGWESEGEGTEGNGVGKSFTRNGGRMGSSIGVLNDVHRSVGLVHPFMCAHQVVQRYVNPHLAVHTQKARYAAPLTSGI